jgi:hypothetical protein
MNCVKTAFGILALGLEELVRAKKTLAGIGINKLGNFLCQMRHNVGRTDGESPVQHSRNKHETIAFVAGRVDPVGSYLALRGLCSVV